VHAISDFTAGLVRTHLPFVGDLEVITWGVRLDRRQQERRDEFDVITVSRLVRRKNVDTVLRAISRLGDLRYAVVGDGPEIAALRELARSLGLTRVSFLGSVPDDRRRGLLANSRLFVMCPRQERGDVEGLGLVYFEAFEQGLPVVASRNGGVPDAVGAAGLLVEDADDPVEMARVIGHALSRDGYAELVDRVEERRRTHSWPAFLTRFENLYGRCRSQSLTRRQRSG
jgi:phosphatidylinositol alpha-1,6-mannosyltransferase